MLTLFNNVRRRLSSHLVGFVSVVIANFSQGLLCSAAAHQIGLRMKQFGDFQQFFLARHDTTTAEPICSFLRMVCVPVTRWARRRSEVLEVPSTHGTRPFATGSTRHVPRTSDAGTELGTLQRALDPHVSLWPLANLPIALSTFGGRGDIFAESRRRLTKRQPRCSACAGCDGGFNGERVQRIAKLLAAKIRCQRSVPIIVRESSSCCNR